ncbi:MAG TPA: hypothetical protein VF718_10075 [Allosphingosinicella sp.]
MKKNVPAPDADRGCGSPGGDEADHGAFGIFLYPEPEADLGLRRRCRGLRLLRIRNGADGQRERRGAGEGSRTRFSNPAHRTLLPWSRNLPRR